MTSDVCFDVLGPLRGTRDGVPLRLPGSPVVRRLLGVLLLASEPLPVDRLTGLVWAERGHEVSRGSLHVAVCRLREWLAGETGGCLGVRREGQGYRIPCEPDALDVSRFRRRVAEAAAAGDTDERHARLTLAMALPRGPVLADVTGLNREDPLLRTVEDDVRAAALAFTAVAMATGRPGDVTGPLQTLAAVRPFDEPLHAALIDALAAAGRPAEALVRYETLRDRLAEELGVDPSADVRRAHLAVLRADQAQGHGRKAAVARTAPRQLPPDLPDFTGNEPTVTAVHEVLTAGPRMVGASPVVVVAGQGGVGKTSLVVHVAHQVAPCFPDGQLFVRLEGTRAQPVSPEDALRRVLRALGEDGAAPIDLEDCVDRYRAALAGRRLLVVLDDASGAAQVRPFLPGGLGSAVLVSTRARLTTLAGVCHVDLGLMTDDEALTLLGRIVGARRVAGEPHQVRLLVRQCGRLPLALRIVGARLAARPHWAIGDLVERMSDECRRLDELAIDDLAVRAGLAVSYRGLDARAQRALRVIAYLDPPDVATVTVAALLDVGRSEADDVVEQLLDTRLMEVSARGGPEVHYGMHDLVRVYGRERAQAEDSEADLRAAVAKAACHSLQRVEGDGGTQRAMVLPALYRPPMPATLHPGLVAASPTLAGGLAPQTRAARALLAAFRARWECSCPSTGRQGSIAAASHSTAAAMEFLLAATTTLTG